MLLFASLAARPIYHLTTSIFEELIFDELTELINNSIVRITSAYPHCNSFRQAHNVDLFRQLDRFC